MFDDAARAKLIRGVDKLADAAQAHLLRRHDVRADPTRALECFVHTFSHYHLDIKPVAVHLERVRHGVADGAAGIWYNYMTVPQFGVAAPVMKLIETLKAR